MKDSHEISVTPYKSLFFMSMPCEYRAAAVFNASRQSMKEKNSAGVAYRFLQAREGQKNSFIEASFYSGFELVMLGMARYHRPPLRACLPLLLVIAANILPNIGNCIRYREINAQSRQWLSENIGETKLASIEAIPYDNPGLNTLSTFLKNENINTDSIKNKKVHIGTLPCYNS